MCDLHVYLVMLALYYILVDNPHEHHVMLYLRLHFGYWHVVHFVSF